MAFAEPVRKLERVDSLGITFCIYHPDVVLCGDRGGFKCQYCGWNPAVETIRKNSGGKIPKKPVQPRQKPQLSEPRMKEFILLNTIAFGGEMRVMDICRTLKISSKTYARLKKEIVEEKFKKEDAQCT